MSGMASGHDAATAATHGGSRTRDARGRAPVTRFIPRARPVLRSPPCAPDETCSSWAPPRSPPACGRRRGGAAQKPRRILLLGGTGFVGPHLVHAALARGHHVSMLNRGRRTPNQNAGDFARVEALRGDRSQPDAYAGLAGKTWDAVIDTATNLQWTREAVTALKGATGRYMYVSSTGVFLPYRTVDIPEDGPVPLTDTPPQTPPSYGVLKAQSENLVRDGFATTDLIVRPGYIVGPGDTSDRFTYWPVRIARGGEVLVPGKQERLRAVHRRARPGGVDDRSHRTRRHRHVQCGGPGHAADAGAVRRRAAAAGDRSADASPGSRTTRG